MWFTYFALLCLFLVIIFPFIPKDHWTKFYIAYFNYFTVSNVAHTFCCLSFLTGIPVKRGYPWTTEYLALWTSKSIGVDWDVRNEIIPKQVNQAIIVVNHQSILDVCGIAYLFRCGQCVAVSKTAVRYYLAIGLSCTMSGTIFIDRNTPENAMKQLVTEAKKYYSKCEKGKIFIFPEGTRNKTGKGFLPFKKGAFRLAIETQLPIIPLVLSPYYFIDGKKKIFRGGKIICSYLDPICTTGLGMKDVDDLLNRTRAVMEEEYTKLTKEVEPLKSF